MRHGRAVVGNWCREPELQAWQGGTQGSFGAGVGNGGACQKPSLHRGANHGGSAESVLVGASKSRGRNAQYRDVGVEFGISSEVSRNRRAFPPSTSTH